MGKVQVYTSDEVTNKINAIVEKRRAEGAREKDVSYSSITTMLIELGLRVYEAQMERKESSFNQMEYNKVVLENVVKTQLAIAKVLGINSISPHVVDMEKFQYKRMVTEILEEAKEHIEKSFPQVDEDEK